MIAKHIQRHRHVYAFVSTAVFTTLVVLMAMAIGKSVGEWREKRAAHYSVVVDDATGCHYLARGNALTPRLDRQGDHICD